MDRPSGRVDSPIGSLSELRLSNQTLDSILGGIGVVALHALPGWDAVATSLVERDKIATYGTNDERDIARRYVDAWQDRLRNKEAS